MSTRRKDSFFLWRADQNKPIEILFDGMELRYALPQALTPLYTHEYTAQHIIECSQNHSATSEIGYLSLPSQCIWDCSQFSCHRRQYAQTICNPLHFGSICRLLEFIQFDATANTVVAVAFGMHYTNIGYFRQNLFCFHHIQNTLQLNKNKNTHTHSSRPMNRQHMHSSQGYCSITIV